MSSKPTSERELTGFARRVAELRQALQNANPASLAANTGAKFRELAPGVGELSLPVWERQYAISFPGLVARAAGDSTEAPVIVQALLAYYFHTADGTPPAGEWVSFHTLPDGKFYSQAFQGYSGGLLARSFGNDQISLQQAAVQAGGMPANGSELPGDLAVQFSPLPRLPLLLAYWLGDEDFPANAQVLFDRNVTHYLPTDVCATVGSMLTHRIIKARKSG